ncbi:P-loop containing nucleoside triphosphate hydrolase protein, partial [Atractiella rhizophila]
MGILEKIKAIEDEMARTQKNKATEYHLGLLKAKLAKYRMQLLEPSNKSSKPGEGFDVMKSGDARVALIGFPSVGKSTLLSKMTKTTSTVAAYEYTTLTAIPGMFPSPMGSTTVLDLPGIIEGAASGRGRGRQVVAVAKTADLILMMLDVTKGDEQRKKLEFELEEVGIRLNAAKPDIVFKQKVPGGITINNTVPLTHLNERMIRQILQGYKMHNCDVMIRQDVTVDDFVDVLLGNRKYIRCLYCYNKIDSISLEMVDKYARMPNSIVISCEMDLNLDGLTERIWEYLALNRIYTKKRGVPPDLTEPLVVRQ